MWKRGYSLQTLFLGMLGVFKMLALLRKYPQHSVIDIRPDIFSKIATKLIFRRVYQYPLKKDNIGSCYKTMLQDFYGDHGIDFAYTISQNNQLNFNKKKIIFCPFAAFKDRSLTNQQIVNFIESIPKDIEIVIPMEQKKFHNIERSIKNSLTIDSQKRLTILFADLQDLIGLLTSGTVVFCVDSAPAHIASLFGAKTFEILGPFSFEKVCPQSPSVIITKQKKIQCAPCNQNECKNHIPSDCFDINTFSNQAKNFLS